MVKLTHGSIFSGIGGFDLAARWAGVQNTWQIEKDHFCQKVLEKHFPEVERYGDVTTINGKELQAVDIVSGGFPCQPFSSAGLRKGTDDDRYLWPEMLRIISDVKPTWVVAENVRGLLTQQGGMVFEQVCTDLESEGYEVQPFVIPAAAVGADHYRFRIWILANLNCEREQRRTKEPLSGKSILQESEDGGSFETFRVRSSIHTPRLCDRTDGFSKRLDALGNAIVPQIAYRIFKYIIMEIESGAQ